MLVEQIRYAHRQPGRPLREGSTRDKGQDTENQLAHLRRQPLAHRGRVRGLRRGKALRSRAVRERETLQQQRMFEALLGTSDGNIQ